MYYRSFLIFFLFSLQSCFSLTPDQYQAIISDVLTYLVPARDDYVNFVDFVGGVLRLPFHDAASYDQKDRSGRPSGCVNFNDPGNNGLAAIINGIEPVYQMHKDVISRADYWVLVANVAIKESRGPVVAYQWGRIDCNGDYPPLGRLPDNEGNFTELMNVFVNRMGLTVRDVVALLGAHSLGRAMPENSGYEFYWSRSASLFRNEYYQDLLNSHWKRTSNNFAFHSTTHQWLDPQQNGTSIMRLNADMSIVYNVGKGGDGNCADTDNTASCTFNQDTIDIVKDFAAHLQRWFIDFATAWVKLTSLGYDNLIPIFSNPSST